MPSEQQKEKNRQKSRLAYERHHDKILEQKKISRKKYYAENKDIEILKTRIRYYKKTGDSEKVKELEERLIAILEVKQNSSISSGSSQSTDTNTSESE